MIQSMLRIFDSLEFFLIPNLSVELKFSLSVEAHGVDYYSLIFLPEIWLIRFVGLIFVTSAI